MYILPWLTKLSNFTADYTNINRCEVLWYFNNATIERVCLQFRKSLITEYIDSRLYWYIKYFFLQNINLIYINKTKDDLRLQYFSRFNYKPRVSMERLLPEDQNCREKIVVISFCCPWTASLRKNKIFEFYHLSFFSLYNEESTEKILVNDRLDRAIIE